MLEDRLAPLFRRSLGVCAVGAALAMAAAAVPAHAGIAGNGATSKVQYPRSVALTDSKVGHWARVVRQVEVRARPRSDSRVVTTLAQTTSDGALSLVLVLDSLERSSTDRWYRISLPILPNNSTGWVRPNGLGALTTVRTHLYIDRGNLTATLKRDDRTIFTTRIGVGRTYWPTPRGEFYVRVKYAGFGNPAYGPVAFATSARSNVLTDWPGGGFVGIHGTNEPQILPGRVSHGCIRMRNDAIVKLARLMKVGTPLTIR